MSTLTKFQPNFDIGQQRYLVNGSESINGYVKCDGGVALQSAYPLLYGKIGFLKTTTDASVWALINTQYLTDIITDITYGNGLFVGVSQGNIIRTSTNAVHWTSRTSGTTSNITTVNYVNNLLVYGGEGGALGTSTNGINWTVRDSGTTNNVFSLTYGNGIYVAATSATGAGSALITSTNAINWTTVYNQYNIPDSLVFGNGIFLGKLTGTDQLTSTNAINWTSQTTFTSTVNYINTFFYGNNLFMYGAGGGFLGTSTNAINWTVRDSGTVDAIYDFVYGNGLYVYLAMNGKIGTSTNAINWTERDVLGSNSQRQLAYGNGIFVTPQEYIATLKVSGYGSYNLNTSFSVPISNQLLSSTNSITTPPASAYIKAS